MKPSPYKGGRKKKYPNLVHKTKEKRDAENLKIKALLEEGRDTKWIASAVGISEATVLKRIERGLEPKSRVTAISVASAYDLDLLALEKEISGKVAKTAGPKHYDMLYQINLVKNVTNWMLLKCKNIIEGSEEENIVISASGGPAKYLMDSIDKATNQLKLYVDIMTSGYGAQRQRDFEEFIVTFMASQPENVRSEFESKLRDINERRASAR